MSDSPNPMPVDLPEAPAAPAAAPAPSRTAEGGRLARFIQTYSAFLSSFVIGVAGLVATSIWQHRQSQIASRQAESQEQIARTKADNDWRIARAEILAKNLGVLAAQGPGSADQRFGVLLSLTRSGILDPELAVAYALDLGRENAGYMRAVLAATPGKSYLQLANAFALTCLQRYGVERPTEICKDDKLSDRSEAIAGLIKDEMDIEDHSPGQAATGPASLLKDERGVQAMPAKLAWVFEPYLQEAYERRQWNQITRFESRSPGARLVAALVLATARTGELLSRAETETLEAFHGERRRWLTGYLFGRSCDGDCRGRLLDAMLSLYREADGDFDGAFERFLTQPRAESADGLARLHARLLWCQVDPFDLGLFRDRVLVRVTGSILDKNKAEGGIDDLVGLLALVPEPGPRDRGSEAWKKVLSRFDANERTRKLLAARRADARRERADPPPMVRRMSFCNVRDTGIEMASPTAD